MEAEGDALAVIVTDEERHSVGEPDTDDDVEAQTVRVLLADGEPVPLRDFAPVEDADTDVEGDKEPLVLGVADDVRHPEGDTVGVSDEELQYDAEPLDDGDGDALRENVTDAVTDSEAVGLRE